MWEKSTTLRWTSLVTSPSSLEEQNALTNIAVLAQLVRCHRDEGSIRNWDRAMDVIFWERARLLTTWAWIQSNGLICSWRHSGNYSCVMFTSDCSHEGLQGERAMTEAKRWKMSFVGKGGSLKLQASHVMRKEWYMLPNYITKAKLTVTSGRRMPPARKLISCNHESLRNENVWKGLGGMDIV